MTHHQLILDTFRTYGYRMTLGQILSYPWGYEFRARKTELKQQGYVFTLERGKTPSDNLYRLIPPQQDGQLRFA